MENIWYTYLWIFVVYAVLGWGAEVAFAAVKEQKFVNRGFLNGPYCPIYGVGMCVVAACLTPIQKNLFFLFFGSMLLTSLLEFITGFVLEKFFDDKWWDYSDRPLNLRGYVCLEFSLLWGVGCVLIMRVLHPTVLYLISKVPFLIGSIFLILFFACFGADLGMTVATLLRLKKQMHLIVELNKKLRNFSDMLGEGIYTGTMVTLSATDKAKEELAESKIKLEDGLAQSKARLGDGLAQSKTKLEDGITQSKERLESGLAQSKERLGSGLAQSKAFKEELRQKAIREIEEYKEKHHRYISKPQFGTRRLLRAFPSYRKGKRKEILDTLAEIWNKSDETDKNKKNNKNKS